jgi:NTP pyrophosphatase (non-canonical NTP hydrolase)
MTLDEYQRSALRTARDNDALMSLAVLGLGIAGEAGEVADYIKKVVGHGHEMDPQRLKNELGDVLWYVTVLAEAVGANLSEVAMMNVAKLRERYPDGFSSDRSQNRKE